MHSRELVLSTRRIYTPGFQEAFPQKGFCLEWESDSEEVQMTPVLLGELIALFCKHQAPSNFLLLDSSIFKSQALTALFEK